MTTNNHPNRSTERVTIDNLRGLAERVTLPAPLWEGRRNTSTGVYLTAIYRGPRTGRMFARYLSQWDGSVGTTYAEISADEYLHVCRLVDVEPAGVDAAAV